MSLVDYEIRYDHTFNIYTIHTVLAYTCSILYEQSIKSGYLKRI